MSNKFVDTENGDDSWDGLTLPTAKKTVTGLNAILNNGDVAYMADGTYPHTDGLMKQGIDTNPIIWRAINRHGAIITRPTGVYFTLSSGGGTANVYCDGLVFQDMAGSVLEFSNDNSLVFRNCKFDNCYRVIDQISSPNSAHSTFEFCLFVDCGDGTDEIFVFIKEIAGKAYPAGVRNCTFDNCNAGGGQLIQITGTGFTNGFINNAFRNCIAGLMWHLGVADGSVSATVGDLDYNTYRNNTFANFAQTSSGVKADLATWASATGESANDLEEDPEFLDAANGIFNILIGGNAHTTGKYSMNRGSEEIGIALSANVEGAIWDAPSQTGGVHAGGQLTIDTNPIDGDEFIIGSQTYRLKNSPAQADDIQIEAALADTQLNLVAAVNLSGTEGVEYYAGTTKNADAFMRGFSADVAEVVAIVGGTAGNSVATTETFDEGTNIFDAATLGTYRAGADVNAIQVADQWTLDGQFNQTVVLTFAEFDSGQINIMTRLLNSKTQDVPLNKLVDCDRFTAGSQFEFKTGDTQGAVQGGSFQKFTDPAAAALSGRWNAWQVTLTNLP